MTWVSDEYIPTSRWSDEVKLAGWLCKHFKGLNPGKVMIAGSFYFKHCVWQLGIWLGSVSFCSTHRQGTSMVQVKISLKWPISYHTSNDKSKTYSLIYTTVLKIYFALFRLSHWELYFTFYTWSGSETLMNWQWSAVQINQQLKARDWISNRDSYHAIMHVGIRATQSGYINRKHCNWY